MRRLIAPGIAGLLMLGTLGCGPDKKTVEPQKEIPLPKDGPSPVGGGAPGPGANQPDGGQPPGTDQ
jgi:hypothetical protein